MRRLPTLALFVVVALVVAVEVAYWMAAPLTSPKNALGTCGVLVLGAPANNDGTLHRVQRLRTEAGVAAFRAKGCERIVFSGGAVKNRHGEAEVMARLARELGVPDDAVVIEGGAVNTWQNVGCSTLYLQDYDRVLIVSESLHALRAKRYVCRQEPSWCTSTEAAGYVPSFLEWWKIPAALYELRAKVRDRLLYEGDESANDSTCPHQEGGAESHPTAFSNRMTCHEPSRTSPRRS